MLFRSVSQSRYTAYPLTFVIVNGRLYRLRIFIICFEPIGSTIADIPAFANATLELIADSKVGNVVPGVIITDAPSTDIRMVSDASNVESYRLVTKLLPGRVNTDESDMTILVLDDSTSSSRTADLLTHT